MERLQPGAYSLQIQLPVGDVPVDGEYTRQIGVAVQIGLWRTGCSAGWAGVSVNVRSGWISAIQATIPISGVHVTLTASDGTLIAAPPTDHTGWTRWTDCQPTNTWSPRIRPACRPGLWSIRLSARSMRKRHQRAAEFTVEIARSLRVVCRRYGAWNSPQGDFSCQIQITDTVSGAVVRNVTLPGGVLYVTDLPAGTYDVQIAPDAAAWPVYNEIVLSTAPTPRCALSV